MLSWWAVRRFILRILMDCPVVGRAKSEAHRFSHQQGARGYPYNVGGANLSIGRSENRTTTKNHPKKPKQSQTTQSPAQA